MIWKALIKIFSVLVLCTQVNMMFVMFILWVYIHTGQAWKICLATVGIEPTTFGILAQCSANWATRSWLLDYIDIEGTIDTVPKHHILEPTWTRIAQLAEHWASIPKVVGSIPTVARHIFQACPVCGIYTLRVTPHTSLLSNFKTLPCLFRTAEMWFL